jgi:hypothetical protein
MSKWPQSRWGQGGLSFLGAIIVAVVVFIHVNNSSFQRYAQQYPHDGQDGLGALVDAMQAGAFTLVGVFIALFVLQRLMTSASR